MSELERDIEQTRARLSDTIDRIQDKLTVSGMVDEVMGSAAMPAFDMRFGQALDIIRRNPVPVLIVAAGVGWVLNQIGRREAAARARLIEAEDLDLPVVATAHAKTYDPDLGTGADDGTVEGLVPRHAAQV